MNLERIKGNLKQMTGRAKQKLGKVTDDDTVIIAGRREEFAGKLQEGYGIAKDKADKAIDTLTDSL